MWKAHTYLARHFSAIPIRYRYVISAETVDGTSSSLTTHWRHSGVTEMKQRSVQTGTYGLLSPMREPLFSASFLKVWRASIRHMNVKSWRLPHSYNMKHFGCPGRWCRHASWETVLTTLPWLTTDSPTVCTQSHARGRLVLFLSFIL